MKAYGEVELWFHHFLNSMLGGELQVPTALHLGKVSQFSINHETWLASGPQLGVLVNP